MRPKKVTVTGVATSAWLPVDYKQDPTNIGIGCVLVSGTATFSVEHTFDDIFDASVTPTAFPNSGITAATASKDGNYAFPVRAVRLNVTAGVSPVVSMTILQGLR
jgi:hypothetical protein